MAGERGGSGKLAGINLQRASAPVRMQAVHEQTNAQFTSPPNSKGTLNSVKSVKPFRLDRSTLTMVERAIERAGHSLVTRSPSEASQDAGKKDNRAQNWRHKVVHFLHSVPVHTAATALLAMDLIIVVASLELQIQIFINEGNAKSDCLYAFKAGKAVPEPYVDSAACNPDALPTCHYQDSHHYHTVHILHKAELALASISCAILFIFLVENLLMVAALGWAFFTHMFFVLDLAVVSISLGLELWAIAVSQLAQVEAYLGLLILARMWRFFRVAHGVFFLDHAAEATRSDESSSGPSSPKQAQDPTGEGQALQCASTV